VLLLEEGFEIGDTIADYENQKPLKSIAIDEPTMACCLQ
jgi:predicted membrane GTPase involved in stress response